MLKVCRSTLERAIEEFRDQKGLGFFFIEIQVRKCKGDSVEGRLYKKNFTLQQI